MTAIDDGTKVARPRRPWLTEQERDVLIKPLLFTNPITMQVLGICSALAVTTRVDKSIVLSLGVIVVAVMASTIVSTIRNWIPNAVRLIVQLSIIASLVIVVDQVLKATLYEISLELSIFVGLIITNCIILGRSEGFAMSNPPKLAALDALGNALGYSLVLVIVGAVRELFGAGKLMGVTILPLVRDGGWFQANGLFLLAPSALFIIGLLVWAVRSWKPELQEEE